MVACHHEGAAESRWPCVAVDATCPLDDGVDAAVVLSRCEHRPDEGVSCAVRYGVLLIVGGPTQASVLPYADAVVDGLDESLADVVEAAVAAGRRSVPDGADDTINGGASTN